MTRWIRALRHWASGLAWDSATWLARLRRRPAATDHIRAQAFRTQTRGMGLRMPEFLRSRLRPRWLRLVEREERPRRHPGESEPR